MSAPRGLVFRTRKGWMGVAVSQDGVARVTRPVSTETVARKELTDGFPEGVIFDQSGKDWLGRRFAEKVAAYMGGEGVTFDEPVDLNSISGFHRQVLETTRAIAYGEVRSYAWVANQIGRPWAARAVGQALHRNPVPIIIPCHRVVASDGSLRGFGWGLEFKEWLLGLEKSR